MKAESRVRAVKEEGSEETGKTREYAIRVALSQYARRGRCYFPGVKINGIEGLSVGQVQDEVARGAKFVIFSYCISVLIMTFKRPSDVFYIRPGESPLPHALPYIAISLFLGWWGFPFGLIYTPWAIIEDLSGGKDVTREILGAMKVPVPVAGANPVAPSTGAPLIPR